MDEKGEGALGAWDLNAGCSGSSAQGVWGNLQACILPPSCAGDLAASSMSALGPAPGGAIAPAPWPEPRSRNPRLSTVLLL